MLTTKSMRTLLLGAAGFTALVSIGFHIAVLSQSSEFSRAFENWIPNGVGPRLNDKRNNQKQQHSTRNSVRNVTDTSRTIPHHAIVGRPATIATTVRTQTDTGVDVSDPILYQGTDWHGDTSSASVMGMASGYRLGVYQRFVGSLRRSGFQGHVFLGVAPDVDPAILEYLRRRNVTAKVQTWVNCTYSDSDRKNDIFQKTTCAHPYPDIKIRWSRFPLIRDWLQECAACTGPVLITDVRDSYFQKNPFGQGSPTVYGLQVVEEHVTQTTQHWLTKWPIQECKGVQYEKPMLCSGTTVGTRVAMLRYLEIMYAEMKVWINDTKCRFNINGDDQSMHNYLFYSGQLPFANAIPHRSGGIVNTVGVDGARTWKQHTKEQQELYGKDIPEANKVPYPGANEKLWIGLDYNFTDDEGFFIEADGSRSRVIHQFDRFGPQFHGMWLNGKSFVHDEEVMQGDGVGEKKAALQVSSVVSETIREDAPPESSLIRNATDTGVDLTDTVLYETIDVMGDSSTATVLGMASGYDLRVYTQFVGSLRNSGYKGHVILGVAPDVSQEVLDYFESRNVVPKIQQWVNCSYSDANKQNDIFKKTQCAAPYADIKIRWSRFPLIKDWLEDCDTCTGPVLIMDVRDSIFQRDPFGPGSPAVQGLHVFEEDPRQTTKHWLTQWPIEACKGVEYNQTMLCSGTTAGTRAAMLKYLEIMYAEMKVWIEDPKCRFDINGDDQSIHNYLFYSGQLPFATAIRNRNGGTVNTVGVPGARTYHQHVKNMKARNASISELQAANIPYDGAGEKLWIGLQYNLTDDEGFFTEADGTRSRVVHQWDRFGPNYAKWLRRQAFIQDGM